MGTYIYKDTKIFYKIIGNGKIPIVFLHGWGGSTKSFEYVTEGIKLNCKSLLIDLPPFGNSELPSVDFTIFDYANIVEGICIKENFERPNVVAHSFGGRIALLLAGENKVNSLIIAGGAGMKPRRSIIYYYKIYKHKFLKKIGIKSKCGSKDYLQLSENMKKTFLNIVNTYLEKYAININVPTILFWGHKDIETPFYMAKRLKRLIYDCEIIAYKNAGHFCYLEHSQEFVAVLNSFIGGLYGNI